MKYSPSKNGFYDEEINGDSIPEDAIEISDIDYFNLLDLQSKGAFIAWDESKSAPAAFEYPAPSARDVAINKIRILESSVTQRRIRESILGIDNGWLAEIDAEISLLRSQIK